MLKLIVPALLFSFARIAAAEEGFWDAPDAKFKAALAQAEAAPAVRGQPKEFQPQDPPALPVAKPVEVVLTAPAAPVKSGETAVIKGEIHAIKLSQRIPANFDKWEVGVYRGNRRAFTAKIKVNAPLPKELAKGETLEFSVEIPADRFLLYYGDGGKFDVQGPFFTVKEDFPLVKELYRNMLPMTRTDLLVELSAAQAQLWAQARPQDKPSPIQYVPGQLLLSFNKGATLEQAEALIAAEGARIDRVVASGDTLIMVSVTFPPDRTLEEAKERFLKSPLVQVATINAILEHRTR